MSLSKWILNIALTIVDLCTFWIKPQANRITFVSLTQEHLSSDFKLLYEALEAEKKYDIHTNLLVFKQSITGKMHYFLNCLKQLVEYKKSRLVILNDNNYVISHKKPKTCKVVQVWHACGAIKKFGNEIQREYPIRNYDAVFANAPAWKEVYSRSFGVKPDQVYVTGMPRTDLLLQEKENNFFKRHPQCKGKKLALYAPTFRGNIIHGFQVVSFDMKKVQESLDDWIILYKFHPLLGDIQVENCQAINVNQEDLYELMQVSDCIISDYSSVILDYSLLKKPILGYILDYQSYSEKIGLNLSLEEYPGPICTDEDEIVAALQDLSSYDFQKEQRFQEKYMIYTDGKNTQRCVQCINQWMDSDV